MKKSSHKNVANFLPAKALPLPDSEEFAFIKALPASAARTTSTAPPLMNSPLGTPFFLEGKKRLSLYIHGCSKLPPLRSFASPRARKIYHLTTSNASPGNSTRPHVTYIFVLHRCAAAVDIFVKGESARV